VSIEFATVLTKAEASWALSTTKKNMEERYDASGYGRDDDDKIKELTEKGARFLLVRAAAPTPTLGKDHNKKYILSYTIIYSILVLTSLYTHIPLLPLLPPVLLPMLPLEQVQEQEQWQEGQ
jgi:hypothetical protein